MKKTFIVLPSSTLFNEKYFIQEFDGKVHCKSHYASHLSDVKIFI